MSPFPSLTSTSPRANGLDTLRATAITLVFMYHYMAFVSREPTFGWASVVGWTGVDLFFVLSGYLIANQLFAGLSRGERLSIGAFYARRALRTLPVYWLVLAIVFLFPGWLGGRTPPPLWTFLTFTQNFGLQPGTAFSHAWSLCIEEQFYFVLPLVLAAGVALGAARRHGWALMAALWALGIGSRIVLWGTYGRESGARIDGYYPAIYYATLCRFDEFLPGVAVAMLKHFHRPVWERLMRHGQAMLALGLAATATMFWLVFHRYQIDDYGYGFFMTAFGYSLTAIAFGVLVVSALAPGSWLHRARIPGAAPLALWSYSIYLSHKGVAFVLAPRLKAMGLGADATTLVITVACVLVGALLYRVVEAPFMAWRDRHAPALFRPPPATVPAALSAPVPESASPAARPAARAP